MYILIQISIVCRLINGIEVNTIVSASWDKTAKVWSLSGSEPSCLKTIKGHEAAVWAVLCIRKSLIVTGSADKTIKIFGNDANLLKTLKGMLNKFCEYLFEILIFF